ncbi:extracellular glycosidase Crh12p [[Candida] railenensis]|uniref:Extracellular glycosidase Crh12p n=1 Tax=[Candida] railenensis TaxID=45579 RepID=A0A9P0VZW0_9ASCO|nr:extracellular glycosidase Crh12p [[Candida] railenensis]
MIVFTFIAIWLSAFTKHAAADARDESTPCNPRLERTCFSVNQALGTSIFESFARTPKLFSSTSYAQNTEFSPEFGMKLSINERFQDPSIKSNFYLLYGNISAEIRSSYGAGVVTSLYLQSDDLDEIDIMESIGNDLEHIQTNYFVKGNTSDYERGMYHALQSGAASEHYNTYGLEWTPEKIKWFLNGELIREVEPNPKEGYPTSPMYIVFSIWVGGDSTNDPGTISWSGGLTDFQDLPFDMYIRNVRVSDYSTGDHYVYGNVDGRWLPLSSRGGEVFGRETENEVLTDISEEQLRVFEAYETKKNGSASNRAEESDEEESDEGEKDEEKAITGAQGEEDATSSAQGEQHTHAEAHDKASAKAGTEKVAHSTDEDANRFVQFATNHGTNTNTNTGSRVPLNPLYLVFVLLSLLV